MKHADVIIIGAGVIGLSLACELRRAGSSVLVLEKHQPGREASWAAGGMIAWSEAGPNPGFRDLAKTSAKMYPAFVQALQDESGVDVDFRRDGKIRFLDAVNRELAIEGKSLNAADIKELEPDLEYRGPAALIDEDSVDPRHLLHALLESALHLGVEVSSGAEVVHVEIENDRAIGAVTTKTRYSAATIVNCAGAWTAQIPPLRIPIQPVKGQMLSLVGKKPPLRHVIHGLDVYLIPRTDGRIVIGSTTEDAGFDKRVVPEVIQRMHQAAANLVPQLGELRIHEDWTGLRPCTPDKLPILGKTSLEGYLVATGHYRDGIMLAPVTAQIMKKLIWNELPESDFDVFSLARFQ